MKRKFLGFLAVTICLLSGAQALGADTQMKKIDLGELLGQLDRGSYTQDIYRLTESSNSSKEKFYKLNEYNGVNGSVDYNFQKMDKNYSFLGKLQYGNFYVEGEGVKDDIKNSSQNETRIGIEKNLKDLFYSQNDSNLKKLDSGKNIDRIDYLSSLESEKLNLVGLYRDYIERELELEINRNAIEVLGQEKKTLEKNYELGGIPKLELDILNYSYRNLELDIKRVTKEGETLKERISQRYGFNLQDIQLDDLESNLSNESLSTDMNLKSSIDQIGERDLEKISHERAEIQESIKYLGYSNNVPNLSVGVERDLKNDENRAFLKISKDIFYYDVNLEVEKNNLLKKERELKEKENEVLSERIKIQTEVESLRKKHEIDRNRAELEKSKYEIKKLEYQLGKVSYTDVMDSFNAHVELEITEKKSKNSLNSYIYEIQIKGGK